MSEAFYAVVVLACPVGMGLMMWFMMRAGKGSQLGSPAEPSAADAELRALRAEVDQLRSANHDPSGRIRAGRGDVESR